MEGRMRVLTLLFGLAVTAAERVLLSGVSPPKASILGGAKLTIRGTDFATDFTVGGNKVAVGSDVLGWTASALSLSFSHYHSITLDLAPGPSQA